MSKWNFVYCFTKRLSQSQENFETVLYSLRKSIELSSRFHNIKIITDLETIEYLKNINVEKEIFDFGKLRFIDDIKISVLPHIKENEILVDPDVFLFKELKIYNKCDLYAERPESINDAWYIEDYNFSKKFKFSRLIELKSNTGDVPNIGITKFFNKDFLKKYIDRYNFVRSIALEEESILDDYPQYSILLGQLLLQNIIDENEYKVKYAKHQRQNEYYHLAGAQKYNKNYLKNILEKKDTNSLI